MYADINHHDGDQRTLFWHLSGKWGSEATHTLNVFIKPDVGRALGLCSHLQYVCGKC